MTQITARRRPADERGYTEFEWLKSWHTFAFGGYQDDEHHSFRALRVINEDIVAPGHGFPEHPHRNMEILTYVISGELSHRDSLGHTHTVQAGQVQYMSAGTGVTHSEFNASPTQSVHLLQIWITPHALGLRPAYADWSAPEKTGELTLIACSEGADSALAVRQDVRLFLGHVREGESLSFATQEDRGVWLQMISGELALPEETLRAGDGFASEGISSLELSAASDARFLLFDLA